MAAGTETIQAEPALAMQSLGAAGTGAAKAAGEHTQPAPEGDFGDRDLR